MKIGILKTVGKFSIFPQQHMLFRYFFNSSLIWSISILVSYVKPLISISTYKVEITTDDTVSVLGQEEGYIIKYGLSPYFIVYPNVGPNTDIFPFLRMIYWFFLLQQLLFFKKMDQHISISAISVFWMWKNFHICISSALSYFFIF